MQRLAIVLCVWPLSMLIGCSPHFMPMEDYGIVFDLDVRGGVNSSTYQGFICTPDESACGRRKVNADLYDPDILIIDYDGDERDQAFIPTGAQTELIEAGLFGDAGTSVGQDSFRGFFMNDLDFVAMDLPPFVQISMPTDGAELSRSSLGSVRVEWAQSNQKLPMQWNFFALDNEMELLPCDMLAWGNFAGDGEDTGFLEIPLDVFPSDLPPEGCEVAIRVMRVKSYDLPAGVKNGHIRTNVIDGVIFRIMP